jgi:7-cyano-7-deazaguanine synthase
MPRPTDTVGVLCSGGLDSIVLAALLARSGHVRPLYVRVGLAWEPAEALALAQVAATPPLAGHVEPLVTLDVPMGDVYGAAHWAVTGRPPGYDTPDEDVYLHGRNVMLLAKAGVYCASAGIRRLAIGPLAGNPFPDATPAFFESMGRTLTLGLAHDIRIEAPFAGFGKADVIRLGHELGVPMDLSMSCMNPQQGLHCGLCNKCRERRDAFEASGVEDHTRYASPSPRTQAGHAGAPAQPGVGGDADVQHERG